MTNTRNSNRSKKRENKKKEEKSEGEDMSELKEIRKDITQLLQQQNIILKQQGQIDTLLKEIATLKEVNTKQNEEIVLLQSRIDELEQYTRAEDIIISGLSVQNRSYAKAAADSEEKGENAAEEENHALEEKVVEFLKSKNIPIQEDHISACHFLGGPGRDGTKKIIVRFANRKHKVQVLQNGKNLKGSNVYINEHLTKKNASLARFARSLKKAGHLTQTWTRNGKVFAKWKSQINEQDSVTKITKEEDFLKCNISREEFSSVCVKLKEADKKHLRSPGRNTTVPAD